MKINSLLILPLIAFLALLSSCTTLNKDECRTADWKLIGFEDGGKGYNASRIGRHRKACAEYGISPDLNLYMSGRKEGLHKYCIPVNAYNLGKHGSAYKGVCSGYDERRFIAAYRDGKKVHAVSSKLNSMRSARKHKQEDLEHLSVDIHETEQQIINGKLKPAQIILLLVETKELAVSQGILIKEIHDLKYAIEEQSSYLAHLQQQFQH